MIDQSFQTISEQPLISFARLRGIFQLLLSKFQNKHVFVLRLGIFSALMLGAMAANAATLYFNTIYKAAGATYTVNTQSLASITPVNGSGFKFTSINPNDVTFASGNNEAGTLSYISTTGATFSVTGTISRQNKSGNTTLGVNFITAAGEAYVLVVPTKESSFSMGANVTTSSDPIDPVLNAILASQSAQPILSVSSPTVTEGTDTHATFTVTLSTAANAGTTFTPSLSAGTALSMNDYSTTIEYWDGSSWITLSGAYTIPQGATTVIFRNAIVNNLTYESTEYYSLRTGTITGSNVLNTGGAFGSATILDDDAPASPTVLSSSNFNQFSACAGSPSVAQTFTVSGTLLTANMSVTAPTGYEVSLDGSNYSSSLSITPVSGTVSTTTVYVRLASTATSNLSGFILTTSTGANVSNAGIFSPSVVNTLPTITSSTPNSRSGAGTVTISATPSAGATVDWYDAPTGGSLLALSTWNFITPSISTTTTYYAEARRMTSGCISVSRTAVVATVNSASSDTDGDGVSDTQEALDGTNPNDGCSYLVASQVFANTTSTWRNADCDGDGTANGTDSEPLNFCVGGTGQVPANGTAAYDIFRYQDCDNDGILNGLECTTGVTCPDFDNDGIPNYLDTDSDNDQIGDVTEGNIDTDGDGKPNYLDLDSDNDGILDSRETTQDRDGDGIPNYLDLESDGDGILDTVEATADYRALEDSNGDGVCDRSGVTSDANYNGIPDQLEPAYGGRMLEVPDTDKDGTPDFLDLESDGDGILDSIELTGDMDGDQHPNYRDGDSDGDGVSDAFEKFGDMDGDSKPNFLDLDSDGDGLSDQYEGLNLCENCGRVDNNDDGYDDRAQQDSKYPAVDTDKDGAPDFLDLDSDNDGIPDAVEAGNDPKNPVDTDKDGTPDFRDLDSDNDGIPDAIEAGNDPSVPVDTDKDGLPDFRDLDSDNDGIIDAIEAGVDPTKPLDTDGDGIYDFRETDSDNDGILDKIEAGSDLSKPVDTDKDGLPDYRDIDSDNDGISDNIEKGPTATPVDTDGDGTPDYRDLDSDNDGISDNIEKGPSATPVDTDGDGTADFRDLDSDNDGILDNTEKGPTAIPIDTDGDGLPDYRDLDSDNDGISDNIEKGPTANPVDTDGDGLPDYRDLDSDSDTISDNIEKGPSATPVDTDKDGAADFRDLDSDNDGITDKVEAGPDPKNPLDTDKDLTYDFRDMDSDNDGILDKEEDNVNISGLADCDKDGIPNRLDADKCPSFMPQGISPNGDGKNDTFIIPGILNAQPNTVTIFNRWGNIVYEKDNYQNDWHGQTDRAFDLLASDGLLPDGTYYYVVDYKGNKSNVKSFIYVNRLDK